MSNGITEKDVALIVKVIKAILSPFKSNPIEDALPSNYPRIQITWQDMKSVIEAIGLDCMIKAKYNPDNLVSYTTQSAWESIVPHLVLPADFYEAEDSDCDDFAHHASAKSSIVFKRICLQVWGRTPLGVHAFNAVQIDPNKFMFFEPNAGFDFAGELFNFGDHGYTPKSWK